MHTKEIGTVKYFPVTDLFHLSKKICNPDILLIFKLQVLEEIYPHIKKEGISFIDIHKTCENAADDIGKHFGLNNYDTIEQAKKVLGEVIQIQENTSAFDMQVA